MLAQGGKVVQGEQNMSSGGINGIAEDFEKHPLQAPPTAPIIDMVALETVLMEPLEEPPAPAPIVDMVALKAVLMEPLEEPPAPIVDMVTLKAVLEEPPATAPVIDMVALKAVLMEPLEEPRADLDKLAALLKALPYAQMLALGASIWTANTPRTRLTQEILPEVLYRWALTRASGG
jgi:hypothetical protein